MIELIRTNEPALLSYVEALLKETDIVHFVADRHISVTEGSIMAFQRRVLVHAEDETAARRLLMDANLGAELRSEK